MARCLGCALILVSGCISNVAAPGLDSLCEVQQTICAVRPASSPRSAQAPPPAAAGGRERLAVLVVGQRSRYYPIWTLRHVVAPAVRDGYEVDYYAMLSLESSPAVGYEAFNAYWYRPVPNPAMTNLSIAAITEYVVRHARYYGASRAIVYSRQTDSAIDELPTNASWRRQPLGAASASSTTFLRDLHRLKQIELLWNWTVNTMPTSAYKQVLLVRDDAFWADDVHMRLFPDSWTVYSRQFGILCARSPAEGPDDKVLVLGRHIAGAMLTLYSAYYHNSSPKLDKMDSLEHFIYLVAQVKGIRWEMVRKDWLPYFTAQHMQQPHWGEPRICLRGITRHEFEHPSDVCVHPDKIPFPFCEDFPLL